MAKTAAERQAEYRRNRPVSGINGERRINTYVSTGSTLALERLARRYCVTKREMLEKLITEADSAIMSSLDIDGSEWGEYMEQPTTTPPNTPQNFHK